MVYTIFDINGEITLEKEKKGYARIFWLLFAALMVGIDRLTKWLVVSNMQLKDTIHIIKFGDTQVLNIYYCLNDGAAFSRLSGKTIFLIIVTSAVILWLLYLLIFGKVKRPVYMAAVSLIIGGGIGNLIDRLFNDGMVIDFIDVRIINFAIFNVADICAVCGAGLLILVVIADEIREHKSKKRVKTASEPEQIDESDGED